MSNNISIPNASALLMRATSVTLVAATARLVVAANPYRQYLFIQNTGATGPLTIGFDSTPTAGAGPSLDPATGAGGQGGALEYINRVPTNAIYAISTAGTTMTVIEG